MTKQLAGLMVTSLVMGGVAQAQPMFFDSPVKQAETTACIQGSPLTMKVGYMVNPALEQPEIGQGTVMHAVARANHNCGEKVELEFFPPAGTRLDTSRPIQCFIIDANGIESPFVQARIFPSRANPRPNPSFCHSWNAGPIPFGTAGGLLFGVVAPLSFGNSFEVRVPIVFDQQIDDGMLGARTTTMVEGDDVNAFVTVNAPFQSQPNPFASGDDIALVGSSLTDSLPVAFSNDDGTFTVTSHLVGDFAALSRLSNVQRVSGYFDQNPYMDFALVGNTSFHSIPVALSVSNGKFAFVNQPMSGPLGDFGRLFGSATAKALTGDFNRDGFTDIALVGGIGWATLPIAFSNQDGTFTVTNLPVRAEFAQAAIAPDARYTTGDFNKDGFADIAIVSGTTITIAHSWGNGTFLVTQRTANTPSTWGNAGTNFAMLAGQQGVQMATGDFNADGYTDLALAGGPAFATVFAPAWTFIAVALGTGNGNFDILLSQVPTTSTNFPGWSRSPNVKLLAGDFNGDNHTDLALTGVSGWGSIPVALSAGFGNFTVVNANAPEFAFLASLPNARAVTGDFDGDHHTDIALVGGSSSSIPVAFSVGGGIFDTTNAPVKRLPIFATDSTASALVGHVNWN